jgi:D-3-phosphoglycerate dehydrogenase
MISSDGTLSRTAPCVGTLKEAGFDVHFPKDPKVPTGICSDEAVIEELQGMCGVIAWGEKYSGRVLSALPDLRVVARAGVGFDSVNVPAATARGIAVTITPTANYEAVAEHTIAFMLAVAKGIIPLDKAVRAGDWPRLLLTPIRGTTLGIVGLGRIGRAVAERALAMHMRVVATETYPDKEFVQKHGIELVDLDTLLGRADFVSLHCPLAKETHGLMNRERFAKMKSDAVLINTARGGLVVEADLIQALQSGSLRGAALDVFEQEPTDASNPLFQLDNVVVSSHRAGNDVLAMENMGLEAAQCIIDLSRGKWPEGAVLNRELQQGDWKF